MEEKLLEALKSYYPEETPVRNDFPTILKIQEQLRRCYRDDRVGDFISKVENEYGEKYRFESLSPSTITPSFGFKIRFVNGSLIHDIHFYYSILSPHFCYFIKFHKKTNQPTPPTNLEEKTFYVKLSEMINKEKINMVNHFYLDENLSSKVDTLTALIVKNSAKYQLPVDVWKETNMYKWMRTHADLYGQYVATFYVNTVPETLQREVDFILQIQKEYFDFIVLPTYLIEKEVPLLKSYDSQSPPTFCKLLFGYDAPEKSVKLL